MICWIIKWAIAGVMWFRQTTTSPPVLHFGTYLICRHLLAFDFSTRTYKCRLIPLMAHLPSCPLMCLLSCGRTGARCERLSRFQWCHMLWPTGLFSLTNQLIGQFCSPSTCWAARASSRGSAGRSLRWSWWRFERCPGLIRRYFFSTL